MNKLSRHVICALLAMVLVIGSALTSFAKPDWPNDTGIQSEAGIVVDFDSEAVLFGQGIHEKKAPASITKILTALVVIENADLDEEVTYSHEAVYDVEGGSGNKLNIEEGDKLTVRECLYLLLLQSSNQTANALAEHVGGSMQGFVDMMNARIAELGCEDSHFANPSGLNSDEQYVSAYDMAKIAKAAYSNETLLEINSTLSQKISPTINNPGGPTVNMEHKLLITTDPQSENYFPYAVAGKTGYTQAAGQTLVTYAVNGDRRLISVTLRSTATTHYSDSIALLNFGFNEFKNYKIAENDSLLADKKVDLGGTEYKNTDLSWDENAVITLPLGAEFADADRTIVTDLGEDAPDGLAAMVKYTYNDRVIGKNYIYSESKRAADEAARKAAEEAAAAAAASEEAARQSAEAEKNKANASSGTGEGKPCGTGKLPEFNLTKEQAVTYGIGTLLAALVLSVVLFIVFKIKKEKKLAEARAARRQERLAEFGLSEEQFKEIVNERREIIADRAAEKAAEAELVVEDIDVEDIDVEDIDAEDIDTEDMEAEDMEVEDIDDGDIEVEDVDTEDVEVEDVEVEDIDTEDIEVEQAESEDVSAEDVNSSNI